jgi:uncharacterized protein (TIGR03437 family)
VKVLEASPALFQWDPEFVVAASSDGSLIDHAQPCSPGDLIVLYATGLGRLKPQPESGQITRNPARLERMSDFRVEIDGAELAADAVLYAGSAPGYPGLYQINVRLPDSLPPDPLVRVAASGVWSQPGSRLAVRP